MARLCQVRTDLQQGRGYAVQGSCSRSKAASLLTPQVTAILVNAARLGNVKESLRTLQTFNLLQAGVAATVSTARGLPHDCAAATSFCGAARSRQTATGCTNCQPHRPAPAVARAVCVALLQRLERRAPPLCHHRGAPRQRPAAGPL